MGRFFPERMNDPDFVGDPNSVHDPISIATKLQRKFENARAQPVHWLRYVSGTAFCRDSQSTGELSLRAQERSRIP